MPEAGANRSTLGTGPSPQLMLDLWFLSLCLGLRGLAEAFDDDESRFLAEGCDSPRFQSWAECSGLDPVQTRHDMLFALGRELPAGLLGYKASPVEKADPLHLEEEEAAEAEVEEEEEEVESEEATGEREDSEAPALSIPPPDIVDPVEGLDPAEPREEPRAVALGDQEGATRPEAASTGYAPEVPPWKGMLADILRAVQGAADHYPSPISGLLPFG